MLNRFSRALIKNCGWRNFSVFIYNCGYFFLQQSLYAWDVSKLDMEFGGSSFSSIIPVCLKTHRSKIYLYSKSSYFQSRNILCPFIYELITNNKSCRNHSHRLFYVGNPTSLNFNLQQILHHNCLLCLELSSWF